MSVFITLVITALIFLLTHLSLKTQSRRNYKNEIVSLGVFGTFIGILLGLFHFDTHHIEQSLPFLLAGLKTAFITSGVGMFCSILVSIIKPNIVAKVTLEHISQNQIKMIEALNGSLSDISSSANEKIITSLEQVVKEFNSHLNEQFGQNFKELNSAVKDMIVWQKEYKTQICLHDNSIKSLYQQLKNVAEMNIQQEKNIKSVIANMMKSSSDINNSLKSSVAVILSNFSNGANDINDSLKKSTDIVEENLQLILREANGTL